ncbi:MAG: T9SS type A sorting domain-containing protein, partial [Bacteroidota bacterium]
PDGGSYSGPGIIGTSFHPGLAGVGTHAIVYSVLNSNGCYSTDTSFITVFDNIGIDENQKNGIIIYPNPTNEIINISNPNVISVELISNEGKCLFIRELQPFAKIDFSDFTGGLYYLKLNNGIESRTFKIIKYDN